jgi:hypothetical protein
MHSTRISLLECLRLDIEKWFSSNKSNESRIMRGYLRAIMRALEGEKPNASNTDDALNKIQRRLLEAEVEIAALKEKPDTHLRTITIIFGVLSGVVALVAICLTVLGIWTKIDVNQAERAGRADIKEAIRDMEQRFAALSGETLKRPAIQIFYSGGPLDGKVFEAQYEVQLGSLFLKNTGSKSTGPLSVRLLTSHDMFPLGLPGWAALATMEKDFTNGYYCGEVSQVTISAGETWALPQPITLAPKPGPTNIACKMLVFFGGEAPAEAKFNILVKK